VIAIRYTSRNSIFANWGKLYKKGNADYEWKKAPIRISPGDKASLPFFLSISDKIEILLTRIKCRKKNK